MQCVLSDEYPCLRRLYILTVGKRGAVRSDVGKTMHVRTYSQCIYSSRRVEQKVDVSSIGTLFFKFATFTDTSAAKRSFLSWCCAVLFSELKTHWHYRRFPKWSEMLKGRVCVEALCILALIFCFVIMNRSLITFSRPIKNMCRYFGLNLSTACPILMFPNFRLISCPFLSFCIQLHPQLLTG